MDSKSVCSRRSLSSRRSVRSNRSSRKSREKLRKESDILINGLDELDLRIAAIVTEREEHVGMNGVDSGKFNVRSGSNKSSNARNSPTCLITNIMQMNRRDTPSKAGHRRISSSKSLSERSVKSSRESREFEIAKTILQQVKKCSTARNEHDHDAASIVSTFSTVEILGDLTDNEDTKSTRSMRSRSSRRSRSQSKSRQRARSSRSGQSQFDSFTPSGMIVSDSKTENERLYNAFMKNLSREEMMAHDTKVLSISSNVKAELSAARLSRKKIAQDKLIGKTNQFSGEHEGKDICHSDFRRDDAAKSLYRRSSFSETFSTPDSSNEPCGEEDFFASIFQSSLGESTKGTPSEPTGTTKSSLSRASSAPTSISIFEIDPIYSNVDAREKLVPLSQHLPARITTLDDSEERWVDLTKEKNSIYEDDNIFLRFEKQYDSDPDKNIEPFASFDEPASKASMRFTFQDKSEYTRTGRLKKGSLIKEGGSFDSPVRPAIAIRREKSLPKASENSFVPLWSKSNLMKSELDQWSDLRTKSANKISQKFSFSTFVVKDEEGVSKVNCQDSRHNAPGLSIGENQLTNFAPDAYSFSKATTEQKQKNSFATDFQGFEISTKYEWVPSGWEIEETEFHHDSSHPGFVAKAPLFEGSPAGFSEFDSCQMQRK